jgi:hypothetical protein
MNTPLELSPHCRLQPSQITRLENQILLEGKLAPSQASETFQVIHSARGKAVLNQKNCSSEDINRAVTSAAQAQKPWAKMNGRQRGALLRKAIENARTAESEIVQLLVLEVSKAIRTEAEPEFRAAIDIFDYFSGFGAELKGQTLPFRSEALGYTVREPLGVVAAILPWNVPLLLMALKVAPALMAGNSVVVKTSEYAPLSVLRFGELLAQELPPWIRKVHRSSTRRPSRYCESFVYRIGLDWDSSLSILSKTPHPGDTGARREKPDDYLRRCGSRSSRPGGDSGNEVYQARAKLQRCQPNIRPSETLLFLRRKAECSSKLTRYR